MSEGTKETPTDFLIRALTEIDGAEDVIVLYRKVVDGKDEVDWKMNDIPFWKAMGIIETCKYDMLDSLVNDDDD